MIHPDKEEPSKSMAMKATTDAAATVVYTWAMILQAVNR